MAAAPDALRVAFIGARGVSGTYSGLETYYEEVGSRLARRGHRVTAYCRSHFTPPVAEYRGIRVKRFPALRTKHLETLSHSLLSTLDCLFRGYDVVQYHAIGSAPLAILPRLAGKTTVVSVRGLDWQRAKWSPVARSYLRFGEWASTRFPDATVVVSRSLQEHYSKRHGRAPIFIPNAVSPSSPRPLRRARELGLESREFLLFVGRVSPEKHVHTLLEAAEPLLSDGVKLVLAGGSSYSDRYIEQLRQRAGEAVVFLGQVDRDLLGELYSHCYAFVLPSALEGLSISLLEALSFGCCVVASDIPENREVIGSSGVVVPAGDALALRQALASLLANPAAAQELRERSARRAAEQPDWDEIAGCTERFYYRILDRKHHPLARRKST